MGKGGGGGAPQPASQTVTQTNLPDYVKGDFQRLLARSESESKAAYSPYTGQRIAAPGQDVTASEAMVRTAAGQGIQGLPAAQAATAANIARAQQGQQFQGTQFGPAGEFDAAMAQKYMDPFMQNVVDVQKQQAILEDARQKSGRDYAAVQAGAFGGSRQAVQEGLAQEALARNLANIQATGSQQAFGQGAGLYEKDRAARMSVEQAQAGERMAAEKLGLSAAELGGQQAAQLAELGKAARAGDVEAAQLLEGIGKSQMAREQAGLDTGYEDFVRQRDYPREQIQFMSSVLRGVPVAPSTESQKFQSYNPIQQALGTGIAGLSLYKGLMG
tara:strand:- start:12190 stop:13179 length:990 start_codon:yes stop_codon:yes gene_type:complete